MELNPTLGLLRLALGVCLFLLLFLFLRLRSEKARSSSSPKSADQDGWIGPEWLTVQEIISEASDIKSFRLIRENGKSLPPFKPGQFLSFEIENDPKVIRSYSISSSAEVRSSVQVSVKRLEGGKGSVWFHTLKVGDRVRAYPPSGLFSDDGLKPSQVVMVAGGIGATPMVSMIRTHIDRCDQQEMVLFYGIRSPQDAAFHVLFEVLSYRHKNFKYFPIVSHDESWHGDQGFISVKWMRSKIKINEDAEVFICGPKVMMDKVGGEFLAQGVSESQFHVEEFVSPVSLENRTRPEVEVKIALQNQEMVYKSKETLLEFFEAQGVLVPSACRSGVCGTCKCRVEGRVEQMTQSGLTISERREGYVLSCVSFPLEDLKVDL